MFDQVVASLAEGETAAMPIAFPIPFFMMFLTSSSVRATLKMPMSSMRPLKYSGAPDGRRTPIYNPLDETGIDCVMSFRVVLKTPSR